MSRFSSLPFNSRLDIHTFCSSPSSHFSSLLLCVFKRGSLDLEAYLCLYTIQLREVNVPAEGRLFHLLPEGTQLSPQGVLQRHSLGGSKSEVILNDKASALQPAQLHSFNLLHCRHKHTPSAALCLSRYDAISMPFTKKKTFPAHYGRVHAHAHLCQLFH